MIKFYEKRHISFVISGLMLLIGIIGIIVNGISLDIQFKGGSIIKYSYKGEINTDDAAEVVEKFLDRETSAQKTQDMVDSDEALGKRIVFNIAGDTGLSSQEQDELTLTLNEKFKDNELVLSESSNVEPFIGKEFLRKSIIAIVLAFVFIQMYIWWRFKNISGLSAGAMALVALIHDVVAVFITFIVFQFPINDAFVAVVLTILGFSINDTIVIYDRIRENRRIMDPKTPIEDLVNKSINQSLTRSLNTAFATFISITVVFVFAQIYNIDSIKVFALPMMMGILSGSYSTICLVGPLWVMWLKRKEKKSSKALKA